MGDPPPRRELQVEDLGQLAAALRAVGQPQAICRALEELTRETIGHRLFTVMRFDSKRAEVQGTHPTLPQAYPTGGRKQKKATAWPDRVLGEMKVFRGPGPADII